jgi:hypothetical protein
MSQASRITRIPVDSSMIAAVGYDAETKTLYAEYNSGKIYAYEEVEAEIFEEVLEASSVGRYFRANIIGCYGDWLARRKLDIIW